MKKYIKQINNENFVYPNNNPAEYDVTIEHEINNNYVTGTTGPSSTSRGWGTIANPTPDGKWSYSGASGYTGTTIFEDIQLITINKIDDAGYDQTNWLNYMDVGDTLKVYNDGDANYGFYTITNDPYWSGNLIIIYASFVSGGGTIGSSVDIELEKEINTNICSEGNITVVSTAESGITLNYIWSWALNDAEPFVNAEGDQVFFSIHALAPETEYYKPWRMIDYYTDTASGATTNSGAGTLTITPDQFELEHFTNGNYNFEFRFIGHRSVFPVGVCAIVDDIPDPDEWELTNVSVASNEFMELTHTGDTTYCVSVQPEWSYDNIGWFSNSPSADYCTSPAYCNIGPQYGVRYFRLVQYLSYGGSITSNVMEYDFGDAVLDSVTGTTGTTYEVEFTTTDDCSGVVIEYSINQVNWIGVTTELSCDVSQPITVTTGDQTEAPYWRVRQITGSNDVTQEDSISNIITVV